MSGQVAMKFKFKKHTLEYDSHASLNDGDAFWEMRRLAISSLCERHKVYVQKSR